MSKQDQVSIPEKKEGEPNFELDSNQEFLGFQKVEVTATDESKPWKPATEVRVTKEDGFIVEEVDANMPFFTLKDAEGNEMTITAAVAGHIDSLHIKGEDAGSKFDYSSMEKLMQDVSEKLPAETAKETGVSAFSIDMGKNMGKEGVATMEELVRDGELEEADLNTAHAKKEEVIKLNMKGDKESKESFIEEFKLKNPGSKVQFKLIRGDVLVPIVDAPKRPTTQLFQVWGPGADGKKTAYTMAPGRYMPQHPNPNEHKDESGKLNEDTFKESAEAWFNTAMLIGK